MKITKKTISEALGNIGFVFGYEYSKRKTIIVNEYVWHRAIESLTISGIPFKIVRVAKSPCTGEISFKVNGEE